MSKILVVGYKGKMGSCVFEKLKNSGFEVVGLEKGDELNDVSADVVVDFSVPENTLVLAEWCLKTKTPLIIGTTGHTSNELVVLKNFSVRVPILKAGNFSKGVFVLKEVLEQVCKYQPCNVAVYEKHHDLKKDSPSGTAKELKELIEKFSSAKVQMLCERGGKEVGEHTINLYFENEVLSLSHKAYSRECFADGVLLAVKFMLDNKKKKLFEFQDIF